MIMGLNRKEIDDRFDIARAAFSSVGQVILAGRTGQRYGTKVQ